MNEICEMALSNVIFMEGGVECRKIPGYPEYFAGSNGVIFRVKKGGLRALKPNLVKGYKQVCLCKDGVTKNHFVHRLVAAAFIPNPENKSVVNHISGDKLNCSVCNLEWVTHSENTQHAVDTGLKDYSKRVKGVRVTDITTGNTETFISVSSCARHLGCAQSSISCAIKRESICMDRYKIEFTNNDVHKSSCNEELSKWRDETPEPVWIDEKMWVNGKECKLIPGFTEYFASPDGHIITNKGKTPCIKKPVINNDGYLKVCLCEKGIQKLYYVHRLVATTFIPNPENKSVVNHISGNKKDNSVSNLEWTSYSENSQHAVDTGLKDYSKRYKKVIVSDMTTGETETFQSVAQCAEHLGLAQCTISNAIKKGSLVQKRYRFEFVEDQTPMTNNNETSSEVVA